MGTLSRQSFQWEHSPGKVFNGNTLQAKFSMGTLYRQSIEKSVVGLGVALLAVG